MNARPGRCPPRRGPAPPWSYRRTGQRRRRDLRTAVRGSAPCGCAAPEFLREQRPAPGAVPGTVDKPERGHLATLPARAGGGGFSGLCPHRRVVGRRPRSTVRASRKSTRPGRVSSRSRWADRSSRRLGIRLVRRRAEPPGLIQNEGVAPTFARASVRKRRVLARVDRTEQPLPAGRWRHRVGRRRGAGAAVPLPWRRPPRRPAAASTSSIRRWSASRLARIDRGRRTRPVRSRPAATAAGSS